MMQALLLSLRQLGDPAILRVLLRSLGLTLLIFVALGIGLGFGAKALLDGQRVGHSGGIAALSATMLTLLAGWLLFRAVAVAVVGLFADSIVEAVERRHYPQEAALARPLRFDRALAMGLRSAARAILLNLLVLPVYLVLLVTGVGAPLLFIALNALLLGRDLGEMVAARHVPAGEMRGWLAATRGARAIVGLVAAGLFVVPVLNLLAPVLGAALAAHRFHGGRL
jgi:uncharacterized protein involved in cysteine biosynthesis